MPLAYVYRSAAPYYVSIKPSSDFFREGEKEKGDNSVVSRVRDGVSASFARIVVRSKPIFAWAFRRFSLRTGRPSIARRRAR